MDLMIVNGKGERFAAEVDSHGRLYTRSNMVSHMSHHATFHKNAFRKNFETVLADGNEACCALIYNTDQTKDIEIYYVRISSDANVEVIVKVNNSYSSGGNEVEMVNTNLSSAKQPTADLYEGGASGDIVVGVANSVELGGAFVGAYAPYITDEEGSIIVTPKKSLSFHVTGTAGNKVKISIGFALHDEGTKL